MTARIVSELSHPVKNEQRVQKDILQPKDLDDRYGTGNLGPRILWHESGIVEVMPTRMELTLRKDADEIGMLRGVQLPKTFRVFEVRDPKKTHSDLSPNAALLYPKPSILPFSSRSPFVHILPSVVKYSLSTSDWERIILDASKTFGLDPLFIAAIILVESDFNPRAVSNAGAQGAMQLMPSTQRRFGVTNPFDVRSNVFAGCACISWLLSKYTSTELALAAYNAGEGAVATYRGIPPYTETRNFVRKVMALWTTSYVSVKKRMRKRK